MIQKNDEKIELKANIKSQLRRGMNSKARNKFFDSRQRRNNERFRTYSMAEKNSRFPSLPRKKLESNYKFFPEFTTKTFFVIKPQQVKKTKKINRLLNKIKLLSILSSKDGNGKDRSHEASVNQITRQEVKQGIRKLANIEDEYDDSALKKLVDNDSTYFRDDKLSMKKTVMLESMKTTFLCSNHCRFQPLINIYN